MRILSSTCIKSWPYSGPSFYQELLSGWSMFFCYPIWSYKFGSLYSFLLYLCFKWGKSKLYWNENSAFMLMPCDSNHSCVSTYQRWLCWCSTSWFDDVTANLEYLCSGDVCVFLSCFSSLFYLKNENRKEEAEKEKKGRKMVENTRICCFVGFWEPF